MPSSSYLSAIAPMMRAGVMTANMSWKREKRTRGMVAAKSATGAAPTFLKRP
jgi:hypothetical protein